MVPEVVAVAVVVRFEMVYVEQAYGSGLISRIAVVLVEIFEQGTPVRDLGQVVGQRNRLHLALLLLDETCVGFDRHFQGAQLGDIRAGK